MSKKSAGVTLVLAAMLMVVLFNRSAHSQRVPPATVSATGGTVTRAVPFRQPAQIVIQTNDVGGRWCTVQNPRATVGRVFYITDVEGDLGNPVSVAVPELGHDIVDRPNPWGAMVNHVLRHTFTFGSEVNRTGRHSFNTPIPFSTTIAVFQSSGTTVLSGYWSTQKLDITVIDLTGS